MKNCQKIRITRNSSILVTAGVLGMSAFGHAQGQVTEGGVRGSALEEVVVTAQRREQNIQTVGVAVTALSGEDMSRLTMNTPMDVSAHVPNMRYITLGGSVVNYNIRGISQNDFLDHLEPPISMYLDDSYLSTVTQGSLPVFDLQRVEVLRGPQGTLFGRNATGGLIQFISNQPTEETEGFVDFIAGTDTWGKFEGAVGGRLTEKVKGRIAGVVSTREGYVDNAIDDTKLGGENYVALRSILDIEQSETLNINVSMRYSRNHDQSGAPYTFAPTISNEDGLGRFVEQDEDPYGTCMGCGPAYYEGYQQDDPYKGEFTSKGNYERDAYGLTLKIEKDYENFLVSSITDVQRLEKSYYEDVDAAPQYIADDTHVQKLDHITQEFRLSGSTQKLDWTSGAYFFYQKSDNQTSYVLFDGVSTPSSTALNKTKSAALYAQVEYRFTPNIIGVIGGRYTRDEKELDFYTEDKGIGLDFTFNDGTHPDMAEKDFNLWSARAELQWRPTDQSMFYASYNRGTKGGGFSLTAYLPIDPERFPFDDETLHAYEIGAKLDLFDGRARLNANAFYYDYKNYQAFNFQTLNGNPVGSILNKDGTLEGAEIELTVMPTENWTFKLNVAHLNTNVEDIQLPTGRVVDRDFPQSPTLSGNAMVRYDTALNENYGGSIQFNAVYNGSQSLTVLSAPNEREDSYSTGELRVGLAPLDGRWEAAIFAKNIWNEEYRIFAFDLSSLGTIAQSYARDRTVGVNFRYNF